MALVNPEENRREIRNLIIKGTGQEFLPIECFFRDPIYIGTAQEKNFVWHLFEVSDEIPRSR